MDLHGRFPEAQEDSIRPFSFGSRYHSLPPDPISEKTNREPKVINGALFIHSCLVFPPGRVIKLVRLNPILGGVLFSCYDAFLTASYLQWIPATLPSTSLLFNFLYSAYSLRSLYAVFELLTCSFAMSKLDALLNSTGNKTS